MLLSKLRYLTLCRLHRDVLIVVQLTFTTLTNGAEALAVTNEYKSDVGVAPQGARLACVYSGCWEVEEEWVGAGAVSQS